MVSVWICEIRGRNILVTHGPFHIQHSTFSTSLPQIYNVFPVAPRPASKYAILAHLCNHLTFSRLPFEGPILLSPTPHSALRLGIFRPSKYALPHLHPLPSAPPSLTYRTSIHAQRPSHRSSSVIPNAPNHLPRPLFRPKFRHSFCTKICNKQRWLSCLSSSAYLVVIRIMNLFVKPNEQNRACSSYAMARKGAM